MNRESMIQAFFDEYYFVPAEQTAQRVFCSLSSAGAFADCGGGSAMTQAYLIAMLVSRCIRELQRYLKTGDEALVGKQMYCWRCVPVPAGSRIRVTGWVERLGEREVTFRVKAQDEQEEVYEGRIRFAIVQRAEMARLFSIKRAAIARREIFGAT